MDKKQIKTKKLNSLAIYYDTINVKKIAYALR